MDFGEKLQELRKNKKLTQEELAECLYVSRTAISKWESGRGYPNIDSLRAIAKYFSVSVDFLLNSDELLILTEEHEKQTKSRDRDLIFGLTDLCMVLLFLLPMFASRTDGIIQEASLATVVGISTYMKVAYLISVITSGISGVAAISLQNSTSPLWTKYKRSFSLILGVFSVLLFTLSLQPYAAVFSFSLLAIKIFCMIKPQ